MCGRFVLTSPTDSVRQLFGVETKANLPPRYNLAPSEVVMTIRAGDESGNDVARHMAPCVWGLVPAWAKAMLPSPYINARIETASEKPSFRSAYKRRRCLVPANAWYEWRLEDGVKQPYAIMPTPGDMGSGTDDGLFAFAGLWEVWAGPDGGDNYQTVTIMTAAATQSLKPVHHRRPLVVMAESYDHWLQPHDPMPRHFLRDCHFAPEEAFCYFPVDRRVGNVRFDDPSCLDEIRPDRHQTLVPKAVQGELF